MNRFFASCLRVALIASLLCATLWFPLATHAQSPTGTSRWYYQIGGAQPIVKRPTTHAMFNLGASWGYSLGDACRKFDPVAGLKTASKEEFKRLKALGTDGLELAAIGLGIYIVAEAFPQVYDLIKDNLGKASAYLRLSTKTCQEVMRDIDEGKNPIEDFVTVSRDKDLQARANAGSDDVVTAVRDANGERGIPWVNGTWQGGVGQPPVIVVQDTTVAGYNLLLGRAPDTHTPPPATGTLDPVVELWPTPGDAANWVVDVVGDTHIRTFDGAPREGRAGRGLMPVLDDEVELLRVDFDALLDGATPLTFEALKDISPPNALLTRDLVDAIREMPVDEAAVARERLVNEVAFMRVMERAAYARRLLLAGRREPNIANSPAFDQLAQVINELDTEIKYVAFDYELRKTLVSQTASNILTRAQEQGLSSATQRETGVLDPEAVDDGAVPR